MEDQLISIETAKLAKEKGFDIQGEYFYRKRLASNDSYLCTTYDDIYDDKCFLSPTQSLLQKWLREKHKIHVYCAAGVDIKVDYFFVIVDERDATSEVIRIDEDYRESFEEALEEGLITALNLL